MEPAMQTLGPETARPSERRVGSFAAGRLARMHEAMIRHIEQGWAPGLVTYVHHRGREHVDAIGTMAFDDTTPMKRDTIFRLASMTT